MAYEKVDTKNDPCKQAGKLRRRKRWCPQGSETSIPQKRRIDNIGDKNQRRNKIYEENGSVGFGDYDADELGGCSECGVIWHSGLV